jgi:hypothetical protein
MDEIEKCLLVAFMVKFARLVVERQLNVFWSAYAK